MHDEAGLTFVPTDAPVMVAIVKIFKEAGTKIFIRCLVIFTDYLLVIVISLAGESCGLDIIIRFR